MVREIQHGLRQIGRLDDTAYFDGALLLDEFPDDTEEVGRELKTIRVSRMQKRKCLGRTEVPQWKKTSHLRIPLVLPCNQADQPLQRILILMFSLPHLCHGVHGLWTEPDPQAALVGLDRFGRVV